VKNVLDALKQADPEDRNLQQRLAAELTIATDQYAKAVRELEVRAS